MDSIKQAKTITTKGKLFFYFRLSTHDTLLGKAAPRCCLQFLPFPSAVVTGPKSTSHTSHLYFQHHQCWQFSFPLIILILTVSGFKVSPCNPSEFSYTHPHTQLWHAPTGHMDENLIYLTPLRKYMTKPWLRTGYSESNASTLLTSMDLFFIRPRTDGTMTSDVPASLHIRTGCRIYLEMPFCFDLMLANAAKLHEALNVQLLPDDSCCLFPHTKQNLTVGTWEANVRELCWNLVIKNSRY